jgi:hypothetical protein
MASGVLTKTWDYYYGRPIEQGGQPLPKKTAAPP